MRGSEKVIERRLSELGDAELSAVHRAYQTRQPNVEFILAQARQQLTAQEDQRPDRSVGFMTRFLEATNLLAQLFPRAPVWSTAGACAIMALSICLIILLHQNISGQRPIVFQVDVTPAKGPIQHPASSGLSNPSSQVPEIPDPWTLPDNISLDFQKKRVRFYSKDTDLSGSIQILPSEARNLESYNFSASGKMGSDVIANARGMLVLTKKEGVQKILTKNDIRSVRATATVEFTVTRTNVVEKAYTP